MFSTDKLGKYPFLRILIPLIIGISFGELFSDVTETVGYTFVSGCVFASFIFLIIHRLKSDYAFRWLTGVGIFFFFMAVGDGLVCIHQFMSHYRWEKQREVYHAILKDNPQAKEKSMLCQAYVIDCMKPSGNTFVEKDVLLYLAHDSLSRELCTGDELVFYGKVASPHNNGNPYEFDYAGFLRHKGVSGTAYIPSGYWKLVGHDSRKTLKQLALFCRERLLAQYRDLGFDKDEFAVLAALTVGYKEELSKEVRESFLVAGASHVLALSGLHIGILSCLLGILLNGLLGKHSCNKTKGIITVLILWMFAFVSGLSPSVVRAVIMFSLIVLAGICNKRSVTLNVVGFAAFVMLLYNPFYLYDVGFQLSFVAVISIILFLPWLEKKIEVKNRFLKKAWQITAVSIVVQIGTLPIVLLNFSRFPVYSLLANIPVLLLVSLILLFSIVMLVIGFLPVLQLLLADLLSGLVKALNYITSFVEHLPGAVINDINFLGADVVVCYIILFVFLLKGVNGTRVRTIVLGALIPFIGLFHAVDYTNTTVKHPSILFYHSSACPTVHFIQGNGVSYLQMADCNAIDKLKYATEGFWRRKRIDKPAVMPQDYEERNIWTHNGISGFCGHTVCMVKDDKWKNKISDVPLSIDYLYLCKGYKGRVKELLPVFRIKTVILDASLSEFRLELLKKECRRLGLDYVSLADNGALEVNI